MAAETNVRETVTELFRTVAGAMDETGHPPEDLNRQLLRGAQTWVDSFLEALEATAAEGQPGTGYVESHVGGYEDRLRPAADRLTQLSSAGGDLDLQGAAAAGHLDAILRLLLSAAQDWRDSGPEADMDFARTTLQAVTVASRAQARRE